MVYYNNNNTKRIIVQVYHEQIVLILKYNFLLSKSASGDIFKKFLLQQFQYVNQSFLTTLSF